MSLFNRFYLLLLWHEEPFIIRYSIKLSGLFKAYLRVDVIMSLEQSGDSQIKSRANRVHTERNSGPMIFNSELRCLKSDDYILDAMEQTQIN